MYDMLKLKKSQLKFILLCITFSFVAISIPRLSILSIFILPIVVGLTGYLNFPKYVIKSDMIILSIILIILFSVFNFYLVYFYELNENSGIIKDFIIPTYTVIILYLIGLCLNFRKMPFYPFNMMIINIFLFSGAIIWVFLSVGKQVEWTITIERLLIPTREVGSFWWAKDNLSTINGPSLDIFSYLGLSLMGVFLCHILNEVFVLKIIDFIKNSFLLLFVFFLVIMSAYSSIALGARTPIIVLIVTIISTILFIKFETKSLSQNYILSFLLGILLLFVLVFGNQIIEGIIDLTTNTGVGARLTKEGLKSPRYEIWLSGIENIFNYPWGGRKFSIVTGDSFFHNIWLDQWYDAGILSMLLLLVFHFIHIFFIIKFFKLNFPLMIKTFILCSIIAFLAGFLQNPVIQASYIYFGISCFFLGSLVRLTQDQKYINHLRNSETFNSYKYSETKFTKI